MMTERLQRLGEILERSQDMLECARDQRWDSLPELSTGRSRAIEAYGRLCAARSANEDPGDESALLARILAINEELVALGSTHKQSLADSLSGNRRQRSAALAYSDASTGHRVV